MVSFSVLKSYALVFVLVCLTAFLLSAIGSVPYIFTVAGFAAWGFAGHLITIDDDRPGGWSNPGGNMSFLWVRLAIKAAVLIGLVGITLFFPALRAFGA